MKKEKTIGLRVGLPAFYVLELEDVYRYTEGAHRALSFPDFAGFLVGLGLEAYRKGSTAPETRQEKTLVSKDKEQEPVHLFDMDPAGLHDLFREFDEAMEQNGNLRV